MLRIGVLGASFDPPTRGHADCIEQALPHFDKILLIPSVAHAFQKPLTPIAQRLKMLRLFVTQWEQQHDIAIVNIESALQAMQTPQAPIYTYQVLKTLQGYFESVTEAFEMQFIVGPDIADRNVWEKFYRYQDIERQWPLFVVSERMACRSTDVRQLVKTHSTPSKPALEAMVLPAIADYLLDTQIYQTPHEDILKINPPQTQLKCCLFRIEGDSLQIWLDEKAQGQWGLPEKSLQDLHEPLQGHVETHLTSILGDKLHYFEQAMTHSVYVASIWQIAIVYFALCQGDMATRKGHWFNLADIKTNVSAHDCEQIEKCLERIKNKAQYTSLPVYLLPPRFTLSALQKAFELVLGYKLEKKSFRRRFLEAHLLQETGYFTKASHRPAKEYALMHTSLYVFSRIIEGVRQIG